MLLKNNAFFKMFLLFIFFTDVLNQNNEVVYFEFKSLYKDGANIGDSFVSNLQERSLYSKVIIGEQNHEIMMLLSMSHPFFSLNPIHFVNKENNFDTKYDFKESKTFKNITCPQKFFIESKNDIKAKEMFKLTLFNFKNNEYIEKIIDDMDIILGVNNQYKENPYIINLGLELIRKNKDIDKQEYNFIYQLKSRKIIDDYYITYIFEKGKNKNGQNLYNSDELFNSNGKIIIGDLINYYQSKNFSKSQLVSTYSSNVDSSLLNWAINFNNIYYIFGNKKENELYKIVNLDINNFVIQAPRSYQYNIKFQYFNDYLFKKVCHLYSDYGFETYYCDKSENFSISNLESFPPIFFQSNELQYTFELNYEDLFVEKDGKFWFLVTFPTFNEISEWYIGNIFLRKYNLLFNYDSKIISFYNPNLQREDNDSSNKNNSKSNDITIKILIIIIVILSVFSVSIGILVGKLYYQNKKYKVRLNELNDSFEYETKEKIQKEFGNDPESNLIGI